MLPVTPQIDARIRRLFRFQLTADQDKAVADVCRDLGGDRPMQRLLQADVGAGKTAVAVYALLVTVANKHQAVLMAPTEVLARQHWHTLEGYLAQSRVRRLLLTGGLTPKERREALAAIKAGEVDLVVGTQALVQEDVQFARLGLVVIDEQHKFGVNQRARVKRLGVDPHYLVMTATPIPRTMALTVFGDLDVSVMRQLPPGRQAGADALAAPRRARPALRADAQGAAPGAAGVRRLPAGGGVGDARPEGRGADARGAASGGRSTSSASACCTAGMEEEAKAAVMDRFRAREIDLLVCTSVVEVGVDVPNATLMLVEHAERFGLSQLHQLRGRVSRGTVPGQCWLFADPAGDEARERLRAFGRTDQRLRPGGGGRPAARRRRVLRHAAARPGRAAVGRRAARRRRAATGAQGRNRAW